MLPSLPRSELIYLIGISDVEKRGLSQGSLLANCTNKYFVALHNEPCQRRSDDEQANRSSNNDMSNLLLLESNLLLLE